MKIIKNPPNDLVGFWLVVDTGTTWAVTLRTWKEATLFLHKNGTTGAAIPRGEEKTASTSLGNHA